MQTALAGQAQGLAHKGVAGDDDHTMHVVGHGDERARQRRSAVTRPIADNVRHAPHIS
jgi:hypothetical protein